MNYELCFVTAPAPLGLFPFLPLILKVIYVSAFQGPTEKEQIDVQGDIIYDIVEFITDTWPDVTLLILLYLFFVRINSLND